MSRFNYITNLKPNVEFFCGGAAGGAGEEEGDGIYFASSFEYIFKFISSLLDCELLWTGTFS